MFKPKKPKSEKKKKVVNDDEDTVDVDFPPAPTSDRQEEFLKNSSVKAAKNNR